MSDINLRGTYAGFVTRAAAFILDIIFISITVGVVNWFVRALLGFVGVNLSFCPPITGATFLRGLLCQIAAWTMLIFTISFPFIYWIFFWTLSGQTPGKFFLRLRVIPEGGGRITLLRAVLRLIGYWASILTLGYGFLKVLVEDRRRGMHDRIAGTCVIYDWDARQDIHFLEKVNQKVADARRRAARLRHSSSPQLPAELPEAQPVEADTARQLEQLEAGVEDIAETQAF